MKIRVAVVGEIKPGECVSPDCPLTRMYGPHEHEIPGKLLKVHPEDYLAAPGRADKLRAAGMGVDLGGDDD